MGPLDSSTSGVHSGVVDIEAPPCSQLFSFRSESLRRLSGSTVSSPDGGRRERGTSIKTKPEVETKAAEASGAAKGFQRETEESVAGIRCSLQVGV